MRKVYLRQKKYGQIIKKLSQKSRKEKMVAQIRMAMGEKERSRYKMVLTRLGEGLDMSWGSRATGISALPWLNDITQQLVQRN